MKNNLRIATGDDNGDEIKVLNVLRIDHAITAKKLAGTINMGSRKISRIIKELREKGRIVRIGSDRKEYWEIQGK